MNDKARWSFRLVCGGPFPPKSCVPRKQTSRCRGLVVLGSLVVFGGMNRALPGVLGIFKKILPPSLLGVPRTLRSWCLPMSTPDLSLATGPFEVLAHLRWQNKRGSAETQGLHYRGIRNSRIPSWLRWPARHSCIMRTIAHSQPATPSDIHTGTHV